MTQKCLNACEFVKNFGTWGCLLCGARSNMEWREVKMRGWKFGLWLVVLSCWLPQTFADQAAKGGKAPKKQKYYNTAAKVYNENATPEEDYEAANIAYKGGEFIEAQGLYERAANRGHMGAMVELADILDKSGFVSDAVKWYRKAADAGDPEAMFRYGSLFLDLYAHDLTNPDVKVDPATARMWITRAAEKGHYQSINLIAMAYLGGGMELTAAERTNGEVLKWINRSANIGNPVMMDQLANAYRKGKYGLKVDEMKADEWVAKAKHIRGEAEKEQKKKSKKKRV
jgi:hypothetical protein